MYFEVRVGPRKANGFVDGITRISEDYIPTHKLIDRDSSKLRRMLLRESVSKKKRKITCQMGSSSKKPFLP